MRAVGANTHVMGVCERRKQHLLKRTFAPAERSPYDATMCNCGTFISQELKTEPNSTDLNCSGNGFRHLTTVFLHFAENIKYERCYFNVHSKANMSQLNLPQ